MVSNKLKSFQVEILQVFLNDSSALESTSYKKSLWNKSSLSHDETWCTELLLHVLHDGNDLLVVR